MTAASDSLVYIHCDEQHWVPARVVEKTKDTATVRVQDGQSGNKQIRKIIQLKNYPNSVLPLQNVDSTGRLQVYKDMTDVPFLNEASILFNLKARLAQHQPYTKTGSIIIAVNPYKWYPNLYSERNQKRYASHILETHTKLYEEHLSVEPYIYETSALAYKGLLGRESRVLERQKQSRSLSII